MSTPRNRKVKTFKPSEPRTRHFVNNTGESRAFDITLVSQFTDKSKYPDQVVTTAISGGWEHYDWLSDVVVYGYRQRSKAGEVFNNPFLHYTEKWNQVPGDWSQRASPMLTWYNSDGSWINSAERNGSGLWYGFSSLTGVPGAINPKALANECSDMLERIKTVAITEAAADIESTDLSALVSLKELPETVAWFISIFTRVIGMKRNFNKNLKKFEKELKRNGGLSKTRVKEIYLAMENLRMEYRYAVRPILADMEAIAKFFHNPKVQSPRMTARGFGALSESKTRSFNFSVPSSNSNMKTTACTATVHEQYDVNVRAGFLCQVDLDELSTLWHRVGFNQSLSAMWQMLPLSFVIDWFINLGTLLAALEPKAGSSILAGWVTVEEKYSYRLVGNGSSHHTVSVTHNGETKQHRVDTYLSGLAREMEFTRKTRTPTTLSDVGLRLDINLNFSKILDLITIARNLR